MTTEFLLDNLGLIDDDLIQDAEARPAPKAVPWRQFGSWTACLALVLTMGYALTHLGMGGGASSAPAGSAADQSLECQYENESDCVPAQPSTSGGISDVGSASAPGLGCIPQGALYLGEDAYALTGEVVEDLPGDCRKLGTLSALSPDAPSPCTDVENYVGRLLFEGPDGTMYVQIAEERWAVAEPVQP